MSVWESASPIGPIYETRGCRKPPRKKRRCLYGKGRQEEGGPKQAQASLLKKEDFLNNETSPLAHSTMYYQEWGGCSREVGGTGAWARGGNGGVERIMGIKTR